MLTATTTVDVTSLQGFFYCALAGGLIVAAALGLAWVLFGREDQ